MTKQKIEDPYHAKCQPLDRANPRNRKDEQGRIIGLRNGRDKRVRKNEEAYILKQQMAAFKLRVAGTSYRKIAKELNVGLRTAWKYVQAAMEELRIETKQSVEETRELDLIALDELQSIMFKSVRKNKSKRGVDRIIKIMERRAKLLGLDAPTRIDIEGRLRELAAREGLDEEEVIREATRIIGGR